MKKNKPDLSDTIFAYTLIFGFLYLFKFTYGLPYPKSTIILCWVAVGIISPIAALICYYIKDKRKLREKQKLADESFLKQIALHKETKLRKAKLMATKHESVKYRAAASKSAKPSRHIKRYAAQKK
jgi:uncharacterized membrane protein (DUF106 family)